MRQAQMQQPKGAGLIIIAVLVFLGLRSRNGGGNGAALSGWSVSVSQGVRMGNLIGRTVSASGTVKNDGNVTSSYRVRLNFSRVGVPIVTAETFVVNLAPGGSVSRSFSAGPLTFEDGDVGTISIILDRTSPDAKNGIDNFNAPQYTESHAHVGGSLNSWSASVAQRRGMRARR